MKRRARAWLGMQEGPEPQAVRTEEANDAENAKVIAELAYNRYSDDLAQRRDIESRAMPLLSVLSAAIVFVINALSTSGACLNRNEHIAFYICIVLGLMVMVAGLFNLLLVLTTQGFVSPNLDDWATSDYTRRPAEELRATYEELAGSYRLYSKINTDLVRVKLMRFNRALVLIFFGIAIIAMTPCGLGAAFPASGSRRGGPMTRNRKVSDAAWTPKSGNAAPPPSKTLPGKPGEAVGRSTPPWPISEFPQFRQGDAPRGIKDPPGKP